MTGVEKKIRLFGNQDGWNLKRKKFPLSQPSVASSTLMTTVNCNTTLDQGSRNEDLKNLEFDFSAIGRGEMDEHFESRKRTATAKIDHGISR